MKAHSSRRIMSTLGKVLTEAWEINTLKTSNSICMKTVTTNAALWKQQSASFQTLPTQSLASCRRLAPLHPPCRPSTAISTFPQPRFLSSSSVAVKEAQNASQERTGWARYLLLVPPVIAAFLGKWQLDRRQWKIDLLERRQSIMKGEPLDIFSDSMPEPEEYQRVRATGKLDYSRTQYIGPRPRSRMGTTEIGYLAVTPLVEAKSAAAESSKGWLKSSKSNIENARQIMVLRGWVPAAWRDDPSTRAKESEPSGTVTIEGVVRFGEDPGTFVPDNNPEQGTWFYINASELAEAAGLPAATPMVEVISPEADVVMLDGGPSVMDVLGGRGKLPSAPTESYPLAKSEGDMGAFSVMPRDHLNYAATWFTLMTATGLMAAKALKKKKVRGAVRV